MSKYTYYQIDLETKSPILLTKNPIQGETTTFQSLDYITGTAIRGATIQKWKEKNSLSEQETTDLVSNYFSDDGICFENLYSSNSFPLPLTTVTCKQFPGLKTEDAKNHGVKDSLLLSYKNKLHFSTTNMKCDADKKENGQCGAMLRSFEGEISEDPYQVKKVNKIQSGHTSINFVSQTNEDGTLYFENAIEIGETFSGFIKVPQAINNQFKEVLEGDLRIGSKKTAGYGLVNTKKKEIGKPSLISSFDNISLTTSFEKRWDDFQEKCSQLNIISEGDVAFSITLLSDSIFVDDFFRFTSKLDKELLGNYLDVTAINFEMLHSHIKTKVISGWNQKWKQAIDDEIGIANGSAFLYKADKSDANKIKELLMRLECNGIGERISEGFGKVMVCHPYHLLTKGV